MSTTRLREEQKAVEVLLRLLQREYEALKSRDLTLLEQVVTEKAQCIERLQAQIAQRLADLRQLGFSADVHGMAAYLEQLPSGERAVAAQLWTQLEQDVGQLRDQNDINGAIIAAGRNQVERSLAILSGRNSLDFLYDQGTRKVFGGNQRGPIAKA